MTKIRSFRVFSVAKVYSLLCGIFGLLMAPVLLLGPGMALLGGERHGFGAAILSLALLPFLYAFFGFLIGGLMAFLYNAIANALGGIEIELELPTPTIGNAPPAPRPLEPPAVFDVPPPTGPEIG